MGGRVPPHPPFNLSTAFGINYTLFYQLHIGKDSSVLRPLGW